MNRLTALLFLLIGGCCCQLSAQLDKMQFHLGGSYEMIRISGNGFRYYPAYFTLSGGANYVLWHSNDQISLSANPNANLGISYTSYTGVSFIGQLPCFALLRVGAACTPFNEQKFGIGAGLGFDYTYLHEKYVAVINNVIYGMESSLITPSAVGQITFQNNYRILTIRVHGSIMPYRERFLAVLDPLKFNYTMFGLGILYNF